MPKCKLPLTPSKHILENNKKKCLISASLVLRLPVKAAACTHSGGRLSGGQSGSKRRTVCRASSGWWAAQFSRRVRCRTLSPAAGGPLNSSGSDCHIVAIRLRRRALGLKNSEKKGGGEGGAVRHATTDCRLQFGEFLKSSGGRARWRLGVVFPENLNPKKKRRNLFISLLHVVFSG